MNNNIKITVTIQGIPGSVRHYVGKKSVKFDTKNGKYKKFRNIDDYIWIPCQKRINMTQEAYNDMISSNTPDGFHGKWKKLSEKDRLEWHLNIWMKKEGGISYIYNILDD